MITAIHHLTMQSHMSYSIHNVHVFICLTGPYTFVYFVLEQLKFCYFSTILSYWPLDVQHAPHGKELSEDLRIRIVALQKDGVGYKSSVTAWNWVTVQWPGSYRGFPRRVSLGTGLPRVDQRSQVLVLCLRCRSWLQKMDAWVLPALL